MQVGKTGPGQTYYRRRCAEGDGGSEAVRRLKRKLCRLVFNRLRADYLRRTQTPLVGPGPVSTDLDEVPTWLELVQLTESVRAERAERAERAAPGRSVGEHASTRPADEVPDDTDA